MQGFEVPWALAWLSHVLTLGDRDYRAAPSTPLPSPCSWPRLSGADISRFAQHALGLWALGGISLGLPRLDTRFVC